MALEVKSTDPRVKRTRKLLQQALIELLQEKNFSGISILDITERATVNRATFYAHFPDKYALLDVMLREQFQQMITGQLPHEPRWEEANVRILIRASCEFLSGVHQLCKPSDKHLDLLVAQAVQQEIAHVLLDWLKQVRGLKTSPRVRLKTVVSAMSWVIFGTVAEWTYNQQATDEQTPSPEEMTNQIFLILTEGVGRLFPELLVKEELDAKGNQSMGDVST